MLSSVNNPDTIPEHDLFDALQQFVTVPVVPGWGDCQAVRPSISAGEMSRVWQSSRAIFNVGSQRLWI